MPSIKGNQYVGFWPWPRSWCTDKAAALAAQLPQDAQFRLTRAPTSEEASVFNEVAYSYLGASFEAQLCADGLFSYRHPGHENSIAKEAASHGSNDEDLNVTQEFQASAAGWNHYLGALNILLLLVQSDLQVSHNHMPYWIESVSRPMMVRYCCDSALNVRTNYFGPSTELSVLRKGGDLAIGARIDGHFDAKLVESFRAAMPLFEAAHNQQALWSFLYRYSAAWTAHISGHFDACLMLTWSLVERDLVSQVGDILLTTVAGQVKSMDEHGALKTLDKNQEQRLRTAIQKAESPMAGKLIGILTAHGRAPTNEVLIAKAARDKLMHGGTSAQFPESEAALKACNAIAQRHHVHLGPRLLANAHLALT
jgi:hypothetical protein